MQYRKKAWIGLGIFGGGIISNIILPFPYGIVPICIGLVLLFSANSQRKKLGKQ